MTLQIPLAAARRIPEQFDYELWLDFQNGDYWRNRHEYALASMPGYSYAGTGSRGHIDSDNSVDWFAAGVPAINGNGYHSYGALTNYINSSQVFSAGWFLNAIAATDNALAAPDGSMTGGLIVSTGTGSSNLQSNNFTLAAGATRTYSVFAKAGATNWLCIGAAPFDTAVMRAWFNLSTGAVATVSGASAYMVPVGNGWYRCVLVFSTTTDLSGSIINFVVSGDNSTISAVDNSIYVWQAQILDGDFPNGGPLILTTGSSAAIGATDLEVGASLPAGDFIAWAVLNLPAIGFGMQPFAYSTAGGGSVERIYLDVNVAGGVSMVCTVGGVGQPVPAGSLGGALGVGRCVILMRRRNGIYSLAAKKVDGSIAIGPDASGVGSVPAVTAVDVGCFYDGSGQINGKVEGFFQQNGTFDDAAITAILQAA